MEPQTPAAHSSRPELFHERELIGDNGLPLELTGVDLPPGDKIVASLVGDEIQFLKQTERGLGVVSQTYSRFIYCG